MTAIIFPAICGLILGSFVNVLIVRLPKNQSIITPRSQCMHCQTPLKWWMNIPVLSFCLLVGKCSFCKKPIALRYPIVEITNAVIWILFFDLAHPIQTGFLCMGYSLLAAVAWIDYLHFIIHNILLIVSFLCLAIAVIAVDFVWQYHVLGMIFCPGFIWLVSWAIKLVKKRDNLGGGDVWLGAVLGFLLGPYTSYLMYIFASVLGIVYWLIQTRSQDQQKAPTQIPFGTCMVAGTFILEIILIHGVSISFGPFETVIMTDGLIKELLTLL